MSRPPFEVADIVRAAGDTFRDKNRSWLTGLHRKVLSAIEQCRTAALGGHKDRCPRCAYQAISYNSCGNRHCPKCQTNARDRWLAARQRELLPGPYVHVVFTLPHPLASLTLYNKRLMYSLLFRASAATLLEVAADPQHLGADSGFLTVLHTWGQNLFHHPHVHCVIPAGGVSPDRRHWVHPRYRFFLPVRVLSRVFRGKFVAGLQHSFRNGELRFPGALQSLAHEKVFRSFLRTLFRHQWVVYAKPPFGGPQHVLHYLARYIAPRGDLQSSTGELCRRPSHVSLEGLCPRQKESVDDIVQRRVSTAVSVTYSAAGLCAYPLLWLPRPSSPCATVAPVPPAAGRYATLSHTDHTRAQR